MRRGMSFSPLSIEALIERDLRHNLIVNTADGAFWLFGIAFVSSATILPVYVSHLTDSSIAVGAVSALEALGWFLPQLFVAPLVEGITRVKPWVLLLGLIERAPFLLLAIAIGAFPAMTGNDARRALLLFFLLYALFCLISGVVALPWQEMIARVIPPRRLGRFFAAQRVFGGVLGFIGAGMAAQILARVAYPLNFALCFGGAFIASLISWALLAMTREPKQKVGARPARLASYWRELPAVLRQDRNFVFYLASRAFGYLGTMATAFFAVHAVQTFHLGDDQAAVFTGILLAVGIGANAVWGWVGDRWGNKLVLAISSSLYVLALSLVAFSDALVTYYLVFALVGVATNGLILSDLTLVIEFAPAARRPTYMGLARGLLGPWIGFAPVLGGVLLGQFGYGALIATAWAASVAGLVILLARVREPRGVERGVGSVNKS